MPVFSFTSPNLENGGAIITVRIFPPFAVIKELQDKQEKIPSKTLNGLIDTGASCTAFDAPIATELNLIARDKQTVITPNAESEHFLYDIVVAFGTDGTGLSLQAFGTDLSKQSYDILLGRDVFRNCTLVYNGWNNSYDLHLHYSKDIY
jgi:hypothetical protein